MIVWRIFVGLSQLTWTWTIPPDDSGIVRYETQLRPAPIGSAPMALTDTGRTSGGQDVVDDRQVVRGEVPQHVDVGLDEAEVDAHGVEVLDVADVAAVDELADVLHGRRVAVRVVAHQHEAGIVGGLDELAPLGDRRRERLLDEHVLAGGERGQSDRRCASPPAWRSPPHRRCRRRAPRRATW